MAKTQMSKDLDKAIKAGTVKNIQKCDKCGGYHRFDYDCSKIVKALNAQH